MHRRALAFVLGVALGTTCCATEQRARVETTLVRTLISDEQSNQIGEQVHADVAKSGVRYLDDPRVLGYVGNVGERIFTVARSERSGIDYHIHLIDDPKTVNAFAAPGGHLFVYSGLLLAAGNEAEVAAVIAHEAGHVVGRHVERAIVNAYGLQALMAAALGRNPSPAREIAAGIAGTGIMRAHSRGEETEANEYSVRSNSTLGYDPRSMITFLEKLRAREGRAPGALKWPSAHPLTPDRAPRALHRGQPPARQRSRRAAPPSDQVPALDDEPRSKRLDAQPGVPIGACVGPFSQQFLDNFVVLWSALLCSGVLPGLGDKLETASVR